MSLHEHISSLHGQLNPDTLLIYLAGFSQYLIAYSWYQEYMFLNVMHRRKYMSLKVL